MRSAPPWLLQSLAVALLWAALAGCTNEQETLVLGYTVGEPNKPVALAISEVLQDNDVKVSLDAPFRSLEELTAAVEGGAVDLAVLGEPLQPNSHLNMLMPVLPRVLHVLHHKSLDEPTLRQLLLARSIFAGQENGMGQTIIKALARHYQIPDLASRLLDSPWVPAPNEPPQVYFIFGGLLSAEALAGFADYRTFSLDAKSASSPETLALLYPNLKPFRLPAGIYPSLTSNPIDTVAVETLLVARPDFDVQLAYSIVQALHDQSQRLESAYVLSKESLATPIDEATHTLTMHPGARRFVNKDAPSLLERYAEVLALIATVTLGLGTVLTTWLRARKQRRKDRLDEYFVRLHELRADLTSDATAVKGGDLATVDQLEAEVLNLLVEERLAVDSALVAFFIMSESVRRESAQR